MKPLPAKLRRLVRAFACLALAAHAPAAERKLQRFDGREYLPLDAVAATFGFPKPAPLGRTSAATSTLTPVIGAAHAAEFGSTTVARLTATAATIALENGPLRLEVTPGLSEASINGVRQWLAFPVRLEDGRAFVSQLDVTKILEPRLRPERIAGLAPVRTVVLDPGHGGHDRGAISRFGFEKDFALDIALRLRPLLEKAGYKVVLTRMDDTFVPLEERPAIANRIPDSIFVSIHCNSSSTGAEARGFEIFSIAPRGVAPTNDASPSDRDLLDQPGHIAEIASGALAGSIYHALLGQVPMVDRGLKHARFAVLRRCERPAVLVECGFVSNPTEGSLISAGPWRERIAAAVAAGVQGYATLAAEKIRPPTLTDYRAATRRSESAASATP
ncbi:MAG: N-acetylmuramoyl-L-alanine amidase [Chthoniobacter sp.]|nr:N-acetylmuramoyl-L-alanine amidase [Chthoniobacter sp.]